MRSLCACSWREWAFVVRLSNCFFLWSGSSITFYAASRIKDKRKVGKQKTLVKKQGGDGNPRKSEREQRVVVVVVVEE